MSDKAPLSSLSIIRGRAKEIQYSCGFAASTSDYTVTRIMRPFRDAYEFVTVSFALYFECNKGVQPMCLCSEL